MIGFAITAKLISAFVFATWIVQFLYFLNLTIFCYCAVWFVSDLVRTKIVGFLMHRLKYHTIFQAKQTFRRWHGCYLQKQQEHREHKRRLEQKILQIARIWRCKAQETRGVVLQGQIENRHVRYMPWLVKTGLSGFRPG